MTQVDFYILPQDSAEARWHFACRLAEKVYRLGHRVLILVNNPGEAQQLDDWLWDFRAESFVPHQRLDDPEAPAAPVALAHGDQCDAHRHLLINLSDSVPAFFSRFERLSEVVIQQPQILERTRKHYKFYQERGYPITHRKL